MPSSAVAPNASVPTPLRWVAKIALGVAGLAVGGLAITLWHLTQANGASYAAIIQSRAITHETLGPSLMVFGLVLITVAALLTWAVALLATFQIAGPLFRLSRNLEAATQLGPMKPIPLRRGDKLQTEALMLHEALRQLTAHYDIMRTDLSGALQPDPTSPVAPDQLKALCLRLRQRLGHASY